MLWFTSDYHIGHANIIEHCKRPFTSIEHMEREILERFNSLVGKQDTTVLVGDTFWKGNKQLPSCAAFLDKMNGKKILLAGNHDEKLVYRMLKEAPYILTSKYNGLYFEACHYPLLSWNRKYRGAIHVHGHTHSYQKVQPGSDRRVHVGVDAWNFYPASAEQIIKCVDQIPQTGNTP